MGDHISHSSVIMKNDDGTYSFVLNVSSCSKDFVDNISKYVVESVLSWGSDATGNAKSGYQYNIAKEPDKVLNVLISEKYIQRSSNPGSGLIPMADRIQIIKRTRELTGCSLRESIDVYSSWFSSP